MKEEICECRIMMLVRKFLFKKFRNLKFLTHQNFQKKFKKNSFTICFYLHQLSFDKEQRCEYHVSNKIRISNVTQKYMMIYVDVP